MPSPKDIQALFDSLSVVRKGSEDDFELRASADAKVWGVRMFDENPNKPTIVIYAGPDARELASDIADYDPDDAEDDDEESEDDDDDEEDDAEEKE